MVHWFFNVNIQSTTRPQASTAHSSAESELHAMTQAAVESLTNKKFIQEFRSAILSPEISIVTQTDSPVEKPMASQLGISRHSSKLDLKKVGAHFNPSDVLTKHAPASGLESTLLVSTSSKSVQAVHCHNQFSHHIRYCQYQHHRRQRPRRCQSSRSPSATMMLKKHFVSIFDKLQGVSEGYSHLLVEGGRFSARQFSCSSS